MSEQFQWGGREEVRSLWAVGVGVGGWRADTRVRSLCSVRWAAKGGEEIQGQVKVEAGEGRVISGWGTRGSLGAERTQEWRKERNGKRRSGFADERHGEAQQREGRTGKMPRECFSFLLSFLYVVLSWFVWFSSTGDLT